MGQAVCAWRGWERNARFACGEEMQTALLRCPWWPPPSFFSLLGDKTRGELRLRLRVNDKIYLRYANAIWKAKNPAGIRSNKPVKGPLCSCSDSANTAADAVTKDLILERAVRLPVANIEPIGEQWLSTDEKNPYAVVIDDLDTPEQERMRRWRIQTAAIQARGVTRNEPGLELATCHRWEDTHTYRQYDANHDDKQLFHGSSLLTVDAECPP
jgi:hypothetical protein